ncbi:MAG: AAA family ATPase [Acidobacteriota bacterium]|nr:AAA family ATPase [Acidobacteriota bacterium]
MKLIFLFGIPATGKLTVGQELASLTGYKLFHNHLAIDLLLSVFEFGSPGFVELREMIWLSVFRTACAEDIPGLIFTFATEATVRPQFINETIKTVSEAGGSVEFVELTCPIDQLRSRIDSESRRGYQKLTSVELFDQLHREGTLTSFPMPQPIFSIDTNQCTPAEAAHRITETLGLLTT